jgi:hypothetical protein
MHFKMMAVATAMLLAAPAVAQTAADAPTPKPVKEKKICRRGDAPTGSILGATAICHTKTEWDRIDTANGRNADDMLRRSRENIGGAAH